MPLSASPALTILLRPAPDNLVEIAANDGAGKHRFDFGLTALMRSPLDESEDYFDLASQRYLGEAAEDAIAAALLDHFLIEFIQRKIPKQTILVVDEARFNLCDHFNQSLSVGGSRTEYLEIGQKSRRFDFSYFKVGEAQAKKHRLYFYANNRAASDLENISSGVNDKPFVEAGETGPRRYFYLVAVSSDFFVSSQSRDRITNLHGKVMRDGVKKSTCPKQSPIKARSLSTSVDGKLRLLPLNLLWHLNWKRWITRRPKRSSR